MEGNGPTKGNPKFIGAVLASTNPFKLDLACAKILGLKKEDVPTLEASFLRKLIPASADELECNKDLNEFVITDFKNTIKHSGILFEDKPKIIQKIISFSMNSRPYVNKSKCIGCKKCYNTCPAKAISMKSGKPVIDKSKCISCFCCQEFCTNGAIKPKRSFIAKILT